MIARSGPALQATKVCHSGERNSSLNIGAQLKIPELRVLDRIATFRQNLRWLETGARRLPVDVILSRYQFQPAYGELPA